MPPRATFIMSLNDFTPALVRLLIFGPLFVLPAIPAWQARSWRLFLIGVPKVFFGVYLPLFVFVFSVILTPKWKGAAQLGWVSCFWAGKLVLLPLVLWAVASFYALEVCQVTNRHRPWIVLGYYQGAIVACVCWLPAFEWFSEWLFKPDDHTIWWLVVPGYVTCHFLWRTTQLVRESQTSGWTLFKTWLASVPLWGGAFYYSWRTFSQLPDVAPLGCFVVTAASRGHPAFVGPFVPYERHGCVRSVNHQLLTFWAFEQRWQSLAPMTHRAFRRVYNIVGRRAAGWIGNPWLADAVFLLLKPAEWVAALVLKLPFPNR